MKKAVKVLTVIALVALVAFSFVSCGDLLGDLIGGDDSKGGGGGGGGGSSGTGSWPPGNLLSKYGLSGLSAPSGATNISYRDLNMPNDKDIDSALTISFSGPSSAESAITGWLVNNYTTLTMSSMSSEGTVYIYRKTGTKYQLSFTCFNDGGYGILAYVLKKNL